MPSIWVAVLSQLVGCFLTLLHNILDSPATVDEGETKRQLCASLGADHWIDFKNCKDVPAEIKRITGGKGAHATVVTTASVRCISLLQPPSSSTIFLCSPRVILKRLTIFALMVV
jgi:NADPH:quinone reductase-like Zn-dependent oxidoreductase